MCSIPLLEVFNNTQRMQIMVESPPMVLQAPVQRTLTRMPKRRMADIVNQRQRLRQIFVQTQRTRRRASDLRHFNRMSQPAAKVIRCATGKHLRLPRQPPKSTSLHNAFAIALERRA
jgi:hypothetical protein